MERSRSGLRLSIFVRSNDIWQHRPVHVEIVHRAHQAGLAGATVLRGIEGYGDTSRIHTTDLLRGSGGAPVLITISDSEDRVRPFIADVEEVLDSGLIVLDEVDVVHGELDRR